MACVLEWMRANWGAVHAFTSCSWTSGKKVNLPARGSKIPGVEHSLGRLLRRTTGKLELLDSFGHDPHELLLEVGGPLAFWTIKLRSRPILFLWGQGGYRVVIFFLQAERHKVLDVRRRVKTVIGEGEWRTE